MALKNRLRKEIKAASETFSDVLNYISPTAHLHSTEHNNYPERMFSHFYIKAIAKALNTDNVLLELPVRGKRGHRMDNHIDALIFNDRQIVVAEFKLGWAQSGWEALARDLVRLQGPVAQEIRKKFTRQGRRPWIFVGTDCYRKNVAAVWKSGRAGARHRLPRALGNAHRDFVPVWEEEGKNFDGHFLMWALLPYAEMSV